MKIEITRKDLENPQRFVCEGLGAPEFEVKKMEENALVSADYRHRGKIARIR
jgi:hypothetical protein